jgi:hypothetical protein
LKILKSYENFEILWKFEFFWNFWNFEIFKKFQFSLIYDEVREFRINIKLLSNPVAELKVRENDSHCRSIVLKTMDRSIVNQLEKEKNSSFNVKKHSSDVHILRYNKEELAIYLSHFWDRPCTSTRQKKTRAFYRQMHAVLFMSTATPPILHPFPF